MTDVEAFGCWLGKIWGSLYFTSLT